MKGISILVILSIVWSIISAIIENRKAAKKKMEGLSSLESNVKADIAVNLESPKVKTNKKRNTRNRKVQTESLGIKPNEFSVKSKSFKKPQVLSNLTNEKKSTDSFKPLKKNHEILDSEKKTQKLSPSVQLSRMLKKRRNLKTAIILSEVLGPPSSKASKHNI